MPRTFTSVFSEPDDFRIALSEEGVGGFLVTGRGQFRARLTQIMLHRLRLSAGNEELPRVVFITVPAGMVLVSWPIGGRALPVWGGVETRTGEMVALGPRECAHARTGGPCGWGAIQVPVQDLVQYGRALTGTGFALPPAARWRPAPAAWGDFRDLHRAAIRMAEARSGALIDIECLSTGSADEETPTARRHQETLARFEDLLQADLFLSTTEICAALGVAERTLRECCRKHLGMGPSRYRRLSRMQQVRRALGCIDPWAASAFEVAKRYGVRDLGRFAASYRALYGEFPSTTLRRRRGVAALSLGRPRVKFP